MMKTKAGLTGFLFVCSAKHHPDRANATPIMYTNNSIFIAGSAHLDVLAKAFSEEDVIDKVGSVTIEIGGTACNIATNLAALGLRPILLTALRENSPYSRIITTHLRSNGIRVKAVDHEDMKAAVFSAHIDAGGEMASAVSCMPVEVASFDEETILESMRGALCAILDCNLSKKSINEFARVASNLSIPVFISCVSEVKSLRAISVEYPVAGIFLNRREVIYLGRKVGIELSDFSAASLVELAQKLNCTLVVTCDKDGIVLVEGCEVRLIPPATIDSTIHALGAGDALMAASVAYHVFGGDTWASSLEKASIFAAGVIGRVNCSTGREHAVEDALITLERMSSKDPMTGLNNRRSGERLLNAVQEQAQQTHLPYSLLMVDIDYFKRINDTYGHDVGDETIKMISSLMSRAVRDIDMVCRWGGEEFLCILKGADSASAAMIAERIRAAVESAQISVAERVTVSIGAATWDEAVDDPFRLIKASDHALYLAKQNGRNRVQFCSQKAIQSYP